MYCELQTYFNSSFSCLSYLSLLPIRCRLHLNTISDVLISSSFKTLNIWAIGAGVPFSRECRFFCICICICICIALCVEVDLMRWVLLVMTGLPPLGQTACLLSENSTAEEENQKSHQPAHSSQTHEQVFLHAIKDALAVTCYVVQTKEMEFFTSKGVVLDRVQYFSDLFYVQPLMLFCLVAIRYLVARCYISVLCGFLE